MSNQRSHVALQAAVRLDDDSAGPSTASRTTPISTYIPPLPHVLVAQVLNGQTLRFFSHEANAVFNTENLQRMVQLDRVVSIPFSVGLTLFFIRQYQWSTLLLHPAPTLLLVLSAWIWVALCHQRSCTKLYTHLRTPIIMIWKVFALMLLMQQAASGLQLKLVATCANTVVMCLQVLLVSTSALPMMLQALGMVLPFWLHSLVTPVQLFVLFYTSSMNIVGDALCASCNTTVQHLYKGFSVMALVVQPFTGLAVEGLHDVLMVGECPVCPGRQLAAFLLLGFGAVMPAVVVYEMEKSARLHFVAENVELFGHEDELEDVQLDTSQKPWLWWMLTTTKISLLLGLLWQLLDCFYN